MANKFIKHFKKWNEWRKGNFNSTFYQLAVLFGRVKSPTFECFHTKEEWQEFFKGFNDAFNNR